MTKYPDHISASKFIDELRRYQKGSVSRRHFLGVTGLGLATAVLSSAVPGLRPRKAYAGLSGTLNVTTWPNYFSQENYDNFTKQTSVTINVSIFGSNEEMLAKLQAGSTGWDVLVPTNYTISTYKSLDLIEPLDLKLFPSYDAKLRAAMTRETELLFENVLREDRSVLDLLGADYTFLNDRLARHYGIPGITGAGAGNCAGAGAYGAG